MAQTNRHSVKAYRNKSFFNSRDARALRILSEYLEPESRLGHYRVNDTIVFMGSARIVSRRRLIFRPSMSPALRPSPWFAPGS